MNILETYGEFELPEEKTTIEVIEDPIKAISSAWELFKRSISDIPEGTDNIYQKAVKFLEGGEKLKVDSKVVLELLNFEGESNYLKSLFLSAVHNVTDMKTLLIKQIKTERNNGLFTNLGYKLKKDKNLIIGYQAKDETNLLGYHSKGNIINRGKIYASELSITGVKINFGEIEYLYMDEPSRSTLYLNQKKIAYVYLLYPNLQENFINTGEIWNLCQKTDLINLGKIGAKDKSGKILNLNKIGKLQPLKLKLEEKLKEIEFLKDTMDVHKIDEFDFNKFKDETLKITKEIAKEVYE